MLHTNHKEQEASMPVQPLSFSLCSSTPSPPVNIDIERVGKEGEEGVDCREIVGTNWPGIHNLKEVIRPWYSQSQVSSAHEKTKDDKNANYKAEPMDTQPAKATA